MRIAMRSFSLSSRLGDVEIFANFCHHFWLLLFMALKLLFLVKLPNADNFVSHKAAVLGSEMLSF